MRDYLAHVAQVIHGLPGVELGPEVCKLPANSGGSGSGSAWKNEKGMDKVVVKDAVAVAAENASARYRVPLQSDKFHKSVSGGGGKQQNNDDNNNNEWKFPFQGGKSLHLEPIGSFAHVGNAGLTNRHANGNVVPLLDVAVLFPAGATEEGEEGFVGGKDYLNHRYTDVSLFIFILYYVILLLVYLFTYVYS